MSCPLPRTPAPQIHKIFRAIETFRPARRKQIENGRYNIPSAEPVWQFHPGCDDYVRKRPLLVTFDVGEGARRPIWLQLFYVSGFRQFMSH